MLFHFQLNKNSYRNYGLRKVITFSVLGTFVVLMMILMASSQSMAVSATPMDLYDDVSDLFEAITLDEVPGAKRDTSRDASDLCRMPARKGVCRALIPRWSYDVHRKDCIEFKFGGCDGNDNNFPSYKACMNTCQGV